MKFLYIGLFILLLAFAMFMSYKFFTRMPKVSEELKEAWRAMLTVAFIVVSVFIIYYAMKFDL